MIVELLLNTPLVPTGIALFSGGYFCYKYTEAFRNVEKHRDFVALQEAVASAEVMKIELACAGSNEDGACKEVSAAKLDSIKLIDRKTKKPLYIDDYLPVIVHGDSMKYCGIHHNDLLLVSKTEHIEPNNLKFPEILLIRFRELDKDKAKYKVRRAWFCASIEDDLEVKVKEVICSREFKKLKEQEEYRGDDFVLKDFSERIEDYNKIYPSCKNPDDKYKQVVVSTTIDVPKKEIHFSIHPVCHIVGTVDYAFTIENLVKEEENR